MDKLVWCKEPCGCAMCNVHVYDDDDDGGGGDYYDDDDDHHHHID